MTNKKSALEKLKEALDETNSIMSFHNGTEDHTELYEQITMRQAVLTVVTELAERVQASEAKLEALEAREPQRIMDIMQKNMEHHGDPLTEKYPANVNAIYNRESPLLRQLETNSADVAALKQQAAMLDSQKTNDSHTIELPDDEFNMLRVHAGKEGSPLKYKAVSQEDGGIRIALGSVTFIRAKKGETK